MRWEYQKFSMHLHYNLAQRATWRKFGLTYCEICGEYIGGDKPHKPFRGNVRDDLFLNTLGKTSLDEDDLKWLHFVWAGSGTRGGVMVFKGRWSTVCRKHNRNEIGTFSKTLAERIENDLLK